jgi:hypothetical protein
VPLCVSCVRARVCSRCRQYFFFYFVGSCASHSVADVMVKYAVIGQDSHAVGTWKVVYWSSRVLPNYHPRRRVRFCVVTHHGKLSDVFIFIELVVFTAVREDLFRCGSFDQTCCQKVLSLHYFSKHPNALQNCAFPSPSYAAT